MSSRITPNSAEVGRTGKANFSGKQIKSFTEIEIPNVATCLDVSGNKITNFVNLELPENVKTIVVDNNPILSFQGFPLTETIINFSAKNTPISELPMFRSLAILAIGTQLETINGVAVTVSEKEDVSGKALAERIFNRRNVTKVSARENKRMVQQMGDLIRHGYLCNTWPSTIPNIDPEQENTPVTVIVMRLAQLLRMDKSGIDSIMDWIFAPEQRKQKVRTSQVVDERLTKQQILINFMAEELEDLKARQKERAEKTEQDPVKIAKAKRSAPEVTEDTRAAYDEMVSEVAEFLMENSRLVEEEEKKEATKDYKGLRNAVINLLKVGDNVSDAELAAMLQEQN